MTFENSDCVQTFPVVFCSPVPGTVILVVSSFYSSNLLINPAFKLFSCYLNLSCKRRGKEAVMIVSRLLTSVFRGLAVLQALAVLIVSNYSGEISIRFLLLKPA